AWRQTLAAAYDDFCARVDQGEETAIDPYAAEDPAEFFAVASEVFFADPLLLRREYPDVYGQLAVFYRQDPAQRADRLPSTFPGAAYSICATASRTAPLTRKIPHVGA